MCILHISCGLFRKHGATVNGPKKNFWVEKWFSINLVVPLVGSLWHFSLEQQQGIFLLIFYEFFLLRGPSPIQFHIELLSVYRVDHISWSFWSTSKNLSKTTLNISIQNAQTSFEIIYPLSSCGFSRCCRRCHHYKMSIKQKTFCQAYLKKIALVLRAFSREIYYANNTFLL